MHHKNWTSFQKSAGHSVQSHVLRCCPIPDNTFIKQTRRWTAENIPWATWEANSELFFCTQTSGRWTPTQLCTLKPPPQLAQMTQMGTGPLCQDWSYMENLAVDGGVGQDAAHILNDCSFHVRLPEGLRLNTADWGHCQFKTCAFSECIFKPLLAPSITARREQILHMLLYLYMESTNVAESVQGYCQNQ